MRNTLARGARGGFAAAGGAAAGNTIQAIVAGAGVAVLFARWPGAAMALRVAGGLYLLWLGAMSLRRARNSRNSSRMNIPGSETANREYSSGKNFGRTFGHGFRQGLTVNLLNPAITTFYVAVLPTFIPSGAASWYFAFLAAGHIVIAFACHSAWAVAFDWLRRGTERPGLMRGLDAATGVVLIALAIQVMASAR